MSTINPDNVVDTIFGEIMGKCVQLRVNTHDKTTLVAEISIPYLEETLKRCNAKLNELLQPYVGIELTPQVKSEIVNTIRNMII